jgi:hypothetical protein
MSQSTPWGYADSSEPRGSDGYIHFVSTPSHGGFKVSRKILADIPYAWKRASFNQQGLEGWFEEDCDWCMVALTFRDRFTADELAAAQQTFDCWIAPKLQG